MNPAREGEQDGEAHELHLRVLGPDVSGYHGVELSDARGNSSNDRVPSPQTRVLPGTDVSWRAFLEDYRSDEYRPPLSHVTAIGDDMFSWLIQETRLRIAFQGALSAAGTKPFHLTIHFGAGSHPIAELPLELMRFHGSWFFRRPHAALTRVYAEVPRKAALVPQVPKVLFAWACPPGCHIFDAGLHVNALGCALPHFSETDVLAHVSLEALRERLRTSRYDVLHLLCHGFQDGAASGLILHSDHDRNTSQLVLADVLAETVADAALSGAFLCACKSAMGVNFTGTGQHLLSRADVAWVVATQGNLAVQGSDLLAKRFYEHLLQSRNPGAAISEARRSVYGNDHYWSVPVFLARCHEVPDVQNGEAPAPALPERRAVFLERPQQRSIVDSLRMQRLVSLVGLPGIGKSELGLDAARAVSPEFERVHLFSARRGATLEQLTVELAIVFLGLKDVPESTRRLAASIAKLGRSLLVIDNAEDLMRTTSARMEFASFLDDVLVTAPRLHILLTTRWTAETRKVAECRIHVPPLSPVETDELLVRELSARRHLPNEWRTSELWQRLLNFIDGHPRTLSLVSSQFGPRTILPEIVERLETKRAAAVVDSVLYGMDDAEISLRDSDAARMQSLVASMDVSFETLANTRRAAAELFLGMCTFPTGLPYSVALGLARDSTDLDQLFDRNLIYQDASERCVLPVPLQAYGQRLFTEWNIDPTAWLAHALPYAKQVIFDCHQHLLCGDAVGGAGALAAELALIRQLLLSWDALTRFPESVHLPQLAYFAHQVLESVGHHQLAKALVTRGSIHARVLGDQGSEADCLLALGQLACHISQLSEADEAYARALPLYRAIDSQFGEAQCLQAIGELALRRANLAEAGGAYQRALTIFRALKSLVGEANCLHSIGELALRNDDLQAAKAAYEQALPIYRTFGGRQGEANCLMDLGSLAHRTHDLPQAKKAYEQALSIYRTIDDLRGEAHCLHACGELARTMGTQLEAKHVVEEALRIYRLVEDRLGEANCLLTLDRVLSATDSVLEQKQNLERALSIYRTLKEPLGEANCLLHAGHLAVRTGKPSEAKASYEEALSIHRAIDSHLGEANCLRAIAKLGSSANNIPDAMRSYAQAAVIFRKVQDRIGEAECLSAMGYHALNENDLVRANELYNQAAVIYASIEERPRQATCLRAVGDIALRTGDLLEAKRAYAAALGACRQIEDRLGEAKSLQGLAAVRILRGDPRGAFADLSSVIRLYLDLNDKIGEQTVLGMAAIAASQSGEAVRALDITEAALIVGRNADSLEAQALTLESQLKLMQTLGDEVGVVAVARVLSRIYQSLGRTERAEYLTEAARSLVSRRPAEHAVSLDMDLEALRRACVARHVQELRDAGVDTLDPLASSE